MDDHMNHSTLASLSQSKAHAEAESMLFVRVEWAAQSGCYILQRTEKVPSVLYPPLQVSSKVIVKMRPIRKPLITEDTMGLQRRI